VLAETDEDGGEAVEIVIDAHGKKETPSISYAA